MRIYANCSCKLSTVWVCLSVLYVYVCVYAECNLLFVLSFHSSAAAAAAHAPFLLTPPATRLLVVASHLFCIYMHLSLSLKIYVCFGSPQADNPRSTCHSLARPTLQSLHPSPCLLPVKNPLVSCCQHFGTSFS